MPTPGDQADRTPTPATMHEETFLEEGSGDATRNAKNSFDDNAHSKIDGGAAAMEKKQKDSLPKSVVDDLT